MDTSKHNSDESPCDQSQQLIKEKTVEEENNTKTCVEVSLSKRAQKRLLKRKQWLDTRPERRAKEKAKKKAKIEKIRLEKGKKIILKYQSVPANTV